MGDSVRIYGGARAFVEKVGIDCGRYVAYFYLGRHGTYVSDACVSLSSQTLSHNPFVFFLQYDIFVLCPPRLLCVLSHPVGSLFDNYYINTVPSSTYVSGLTNYYNTYLLTTA